MCQMLKEICVLNKKYPFIKIRKFEPIRMAKHPTILLFIKAPCSRQDAFTRDKTYMLEI